MIANRLRYISLMLSLVSAVLAYRSSARQPRWMRVGQLILRLVVLGAATVLASRRRPQRDQQLRIRIANQLVAILLTMLAQRYTARRPLPRLAALGVGLGSILVRGEPQPAS